MASSLLFFLSSPPPLLFYPPSSLARPCLPHSLPLSLSHKTPPFQPPARPPARQLANRPAHRITQHYILHIFTVDTSTPTGLDIARAAGAAKVTPTFMLFRDESLLMKVQGERYMDLDRGVGSFA